MHTIKKLDWIYREDWVVHADPEGLRWAYYIKPLNDKFELAFIDDSGNIGEVVIYDNLVSAQHYAQKHYESIIYKHMFFSL